MKKIGIGIIGMGWMGQVHSSAYINYKIKFSHTKIIPELIICSEILEDRAKECKEIFGFKKYTTSWKDVVDNEEVDVVDITAPNSLHLEIIEYCVKKGKHINCEKPVGAFPQDSIKAYELTKNYSHKTFVGFNYRWAPLIQYTKELLESGELGDVYAYNGRFFSCYAADELNYRTWRFQKENSLGAIYDLMVHSLDLAMYLVSDIKSVNGVLKTFINKRPTPLPGASHYSIGNIKDPMSDVTNDDYAAARMNFTNGATGFIESSRMFYGPTSQMQFEIFCSKGSVKWNFEELNTLHLYLKTNSQKAGYTKIYTAPVHGSHKYFNPSDGSGIGIDDLKTLEVAHFLRKIFDPNFTNYTDFKDSYKVAKVVDAIIKSDISKKEELV